ncbi:MAG TPA: aspartate 1-decarboxylase [Armatimonadota bacterium]|nr:aspartate 1-decarboxylase [Armatimonadota bacterium]
MFRTLCRSKIHRATVTEANLNYEGSLSLDGALMDAADILPFEKVQVVNVTNGQRFETYAIRAPEQSGTVCLNGAAARLGHAGDLVIVMCYGQFDDDEARRTEPRIILVDERNRIRMSDGSLPAGIAEG